MKTIYTGIKQLLAFTGENAPRSGHAQRETGLIENAAVLVSGDKIIAAGPRRIVESLPEAADAEAIETGGICLPAFIDSHTHAVFAEPRLKDFSMRTAGASYAEIKQAGGGINSSIGAVRAASAEDLEKSLLIRAGSFIKAGTGTAEVKSGYGLDRDSELKMLKAIKSASEKTPLTMIPTLLAAHSVPPEFAGHADDYLDYIEKEIFPSAEKEGLARFADIFCEKGYFSPAQAKRYLNSARKHGMLPKAHVEQMSRSGGTVAAAACGAISADHADYCAAEDIAAMKDSGTIAALLPASNYFLGLKKFPPAREFIQAGIPVAIATDFNPGTCPCLNMQFVISCACVNCGLTPEEALCAATINGAKALGLEDRGMIMPGMRADLAFFDYDDYRELAYFFGDNACVRTVIAGVTVYEAGNKHAKGISASCNREAK